MEEPINVKNGTITLNMKSASNVVSVDTKRLSSPFIEITIGNQTQKTKVIKKTVNPTWNETLTFKVEDLSQDSFIYFKCLSKRRIHKPDFLGEFKLYLAGTKKDVEKEFNLQLMNTDSGSIQFTFKADFSLRDFAPIVSLPKGQKLTVKLHAGKFLYMNARYVSLEIGDQKFVADAKKWPEYNETYEIELPEISQITLLPFMVHMQNYGEGIDEAIFEGFVLVPLENSVKGKSFRSQFPIYGPENEFLDIEIIPDFDLPSCPLSIIQDRINTTVDFIESTHEYFNVTKRFMYEESHESIKNEKEEDNFQGSRSFRVMKSLRVREHKKLENVKTAGKVVWFYLTLPYQLKHINFC